MVVMLVMVYNGKVPLIRTESGHAFPLVSVFMAGFIIFPKNTNCSSYNGSLELTGSIAT